MEFSGREPSDHNLGIPHVTRAIEQNDGYNHGDASWAYALYFSVVLNKDTQNFWRWCNFHFQKPNNGLFRIAKTFSYMHFKICVTASNYFSLHPQRSDFVMKISSNQDQRIVDQHDGLYSTIKRLSRKLRLLTTPKNWCDKVIEFWSGAWLPSTLVRVFSITTLN